MSGQDVAYIKTEMISDESMNDSMFTFHIENVPFHDEKEDACTQTYASNTRSVSAEELFSLDIPHDDSEDADVTNVSFYEDSQYLFLPNTRKRTNQFYKDKTPKTVKMLKEKHRENERLRHHSLNQHLRLICRKVPGSAENGKETKVVMMQRIISYVAYLENTIRLMCSQLDVKPNPTWLKLTSSVKEMEKSETWRKEFLAVRSEESRDSEIFSRNICRHLTLSSPTTDTTNSSASDLKPLEPRIDCYQGSQGSSGATFSQIMDETTSNGWQWFLPAEEIVIDQSESVDVLLDSTEYDQSMFELPASWFECKQMKSPEEVKWLGSPDMSPSHLQGTKSDGGHFGIRCDSRCFDEQVCELSHTITVSPDQVMPQTIIKKEVMEDDEASFGASGLSNFFTKENGSHDSRQGQSISKRPPLLNITNCQEYPLELSEELFDSKRLCNKQENTGLDVTGGKYVEVDASDKINKMTKNENTLKTNNLLENPGLHVSAISKMMGYAWRGMTSEQQNPYREQAQICSQELHRMLGETCH